MSNGRNLTRDLGARLATVEDLVEELVWRIGLLDEQTRQAGYRAQLAIEHWDQAQVFGQQSRSRSHRKITTQPTLTSEADRRIERFRGRM